MPLYSVLREAQDDTHTIKVRINDETEEQVSVFHGGVPESYLEYCKLCESLIHKKDLHIMFDGYVKEETNVIDDLNLHNLGKPEGN